MILDLGSSTCLCKLGSSFSTAACSAPNVLLRPMLSQITVRLLISESCHLMDRIYCHYKLIVSYSWKIKLEAKDILPNINRTQAAERAENAFLSRWPWPLTLTFTLVRARDQTRLPCEFGVNPFSGFRDSSYINTKTIDWRRQKQNLPQFTVCGNEHWADK